MYSTSIMDITELLEDFCLHAKHIRGVSDTTIKRYKEKVNFFKKANEINYPEQISDKMVFDFFLKGRMDRGWTRETFKTYYMSLLVFFRWCVQKGYLKCNYIEGLEIPKGKKSIPKRLTKQEASKLLEASYHYPYTQKYLRDRNHAMFATFLFLGLRKNELLKLKLTDVDIENKSVFIKGKGDKDRIVPISSTLMYSLSRYLKARTKAGKTCPEFFTSSNRNQGLTESGLKRTIAKMRKVTGIYFKTHELRHTFATLMHEGGCDIYDLAQFMGHSDIKTTTIYMSASPEHLRRQLFKHPMERSKLTESY